MSERWSNTDLGVLMFDFVNWFFKHGGGARDFLLSGECHLRHVHRKYYVMEDRNVLLDSSDIVLCAVEARQPYVVAVISIFFDLHLEPKSGFG